MLQEKLPLLRENRWILRRYTGSPSEPAGGDNGSMTPRPSTCWAGRSVGGKAQLWRCAGTLPVPLQMPLPFSPCSARRPHALWPSLGFGQQETPAGGKAGVPRAPPSEAGTGWLHPCPNPYSPPSPGAGLCPFAEPSLTRSCCVSDGTPLGRTSLPGARPPWEVTAVTGQRRKLRLSRVGSLAPVVRGPDPESTSVSSCNTGPQGHRLT